MVPTPQLEEGALVVDGVRVKLTGSEARVVECLLQRQGIVVSRAEITRSLWGAPDKDAGRAVDTHIRRIREKLHAVPGVGIATVRMRGFRLEQR